MWNLPPLASGSFVIESESLSTENPTISRFYEYWCELARENGGLPKRNQIDPVRIAYALPYCIIFRRLKDQVGYECQLCGEELNNVWGRSLRGLHTEEIFPAEDLEALYPRWSFLLENKVVAHCKYNGGGKYKSVERLVVPALSRDGVPDIIIGLALYSYENKVEKKDVFDQPGVTYKYYRL